MSLSCYINCDVRTFVNTGLTSEELIFVDCSGNTNSVVVSSGNTVLITLCNNFPLSGNTSGNLVQQYGGKVTSMYYFSSCCEDNQVFSVLANEELLSIDDGVYGVEFIASINGEVKFYQCSKIYDKITSKFSPPVIGELICAINDFKKYGELECFQCLESNPCLTQCYGLLACDGDFPLITTTDTSFSGYVDTFVNIDITLPYPVTPTTSFLVKDLGVIQCSEEYQFVVTSSGTSCDCNCYTFKTPNEPMITTYVDCDYNLLEVYLPTGVTMNICSIVEPIFDYYAAIAIRKGGLCIDNTCPPQTNITILPRNECDVLTIFPMGVMCDVTNPSTPKSYDGSASLIITGGTPPYTVVWEIGSVTDTITNLNVGNYTATVTDFYGDFVITTTCILSATTTTTTTTTTIHPLPTYGDLCTTLVIRPTDPDLPATTEQIQFVYDDYVNNQPSWISDDSVYSLYWYTGATPSYWTIEGYTNPLIQLVNYTPTPPPLSNWQILGGIEIISCVTTSGECLSNSAITFNVIINDSLCNLDGSILIQATGGDGNFQYSIDNGVTFGTNPYFQGLSSGNYVVQAQDGSGNITVQTVVIPSQPTPSYTLTLTLNIQTNAFQITSNLQPGYTVTFDFNHISTFSYYPATLSPTPIYNNFVTIPGGLSQITNQNTQNAISPLCFTPTPLNPQLLQVTQLKEYKNTFTISSGQIITGSVTDNILNTPGGYCENTNANFQIYLSNAIINECSCCVLQVINPPSKLPIGKKSN